MSAPLHYLTSSFSWPSMIKWCGQGKETVELQLYLMPHGLQCCIFYVIYAVHKLCQDILVSFYEYN